MTRNIAGNIISRLFLNDFVFKYVCTSKFIIIMKKFVTILLVFGFSVAILAQTDCKQPVLLLPLTKNAKIKLNNENIILAEGYTCNKQATIEVISGRISLLNDQGDEVIYETGGKILVSKSNGAKEALPLNKISRYLEQPSVYLPNLYSSSRSDYAVFPLESAVIDKSSIRFYFANEVDPNVTFKIYDDDTNSVVWQTKHFVSEFNPLLVPLDKGKSYTWKIYSGSNSVKGKILLLTDKESHGLKTLLLNEPKDYIAAYIKLLENKCIFDAVEILLEGIHKHPESGVLSILLSKLPEEIR